MIRAVAVVLEGNSRYNCAMNCAQCGPRSAKKGPWFLYYSPLENEQAPVIPLWNCCSSTRRPIETGVIFVNSFMRMLTHMQFQGPE